MDYGALPSCISVPLTQQMATLHEMQEVYSVEDAITLWELIRVNNYNARLWSEIK